ncbi:hypothetical protein [Campylobacter concisus]|nr:hypothetical protein [Campylobacter concisus]
MGALLKFDWIKSSSKVNLITILRVYKFMVCVLRLNLVRNLLVCSLNL